MKWALTKNGKILFKHGFVSDAKIKKAIKDEKGTIPSTLVAGADCGNGIRLHEFVDGKGKGRTKYEISDTQVTEIVIKDDYNVRIYFGNENPQVNYQEIKNPNAYLQKFMDEFFKEKAVESKDNVTDIKTRTWSINFEAYPKIRKILQDKLRKDKKKMISDFWKAADIDGQDVELNTIYPAMMHTLIEGRNGFPNSEIQNIKNILVQKLNDLHLKVDGINIADTAAATDIKKNLPLIAEYYYDAITWPTP